MNIFHLSRNPVECAKFHCDKHVVKMIVEHAQLLSTANRLSGLDEGYKVSHQNHPCAIWVRHSIDNWMYLLDLTDALNAEYKYRYNKDVDHKSFLVAKSLSVPKLPSRGLTRPPLCMPDDAKVRSVVGSYRRYYYLHKHNIATWTKRPVPFFMEP